MLATGGWTQSTGQPQQDAAGYITRTIWMQPAPGLLAIPIVASTALLRDEIHRLRQQVSESAVPLDMTRAQAGGDGILLTGVTGFLGLAVLAELCRLLPHRPIHCVVRAASDHEAFERLAARWRSRYPGSELPAQQVTVFAGDLALPDLGVPESVWTDLAGRIADVVHCAAHLNFIASYQRLQAENVAATLGLITRLCPRGIRFHHVSSVGICTGAGFPDSLLETQPYSDHDAELIGGYAQTKWVADCVLVELQQQGWPITILRPAHVIDDVAPQPSLGQCPIADYFLSLERQRIAPALDFRFYITPLRAFAAAVARLLEAPQPGIGKAFHLGSLPVEARQVLAGLLAGSALEILPLKDWKRQAKLAAVRDPDAFSPMVPYVHYMNEARLQIGRLDQAQSVALLGWKVAADNDAGNDADVRVFMDYLARLRGGDQQATAEASTEGPSLLDARLPPICPDTIDFYDLDRIGEWVAHYGPVFRVRQKGREVVVVVDAPVAEHILVGAFLDYQKGSGIMGQFGDALGKGLINLDGDAWARDRRQLAPMFQARMLARFEPRFEAHTARLIEQFAAQGEAPFEVHPLLSRYSLRLAADCFFSIENLDDFPYAAVESLKYLIKEFRHDIRDLPRNTFDAFRNNIKAFRKAARAMIAERAAGAAQGREFHDILSLLEADPAATAEDIFGHVGSLIAASYDTTNVSLGFVLKQLSLDPSLQDTLRAEVMACAVDGLSFKATLQMRRIRSFLQECLRLYPPVWSIPRRSIATHRVKGWILPADADYLIYSFHLHRSRRWWRDPERFDPERFLPPNTGATHRAAYQPFSLGPRTCIGMGFALYELALLVAKLLERFRILPVPQSFQPVPLYPVLSSSVPTQIRLITR